MARPESLADIDINEVDMGNVDVKTMHTDPALLKAYAVFIESLKKAGNVRFEDNYYGVRMYRQPTLAEQITQLNEAQNAWDSAHAVYEKWANGEALEAEWQMDTAKRHAQENGLPMFTWEREGKTEASVDDTLAGIDEVLADA